MEKIFQSHITVKNPYDETITINKTENNLIKSQLIKPCLDYKKEKKGLFVLTREMQRQEQKEKIKAKKQIDLSPFQFNFPLTLSQNFEMQEKEKESNQRESKENSDFEIDVMTESWGLNKLEKMEKELDGDTYNDRIKILLGNKQKQQEHKQEQEVEKEENIEEINIANEENEDEFNLSKNSIIDITEMRGSEIDKDPLINFKDLEQSFSESIQKQSNKNRYLRGHCPFNFFEKEKCKNIDFKKVSLRTYISNISAQWKVMTDEEKEPYVKLSEDFKRKILSGHNLDDIEEMKLSNKKRRRRKRNINRIKKANNNEEKKIINNNINFNNNKIENFSVYTTSRYVKKNKNKAKIKKKIISKEKKINVNNTSSYIQKAFERSENNKKENNNNILNQIIGKFKEFKNISENKTNEFFKTILIPFVIKSFAFLYSLKSENNNEQSPYI